MKSGLLIAAMLLINLSSLPAALADDMNATDIMQRKDVGVAIVTVTDYGTGADDQINNKPIKQAKVESQPCDAARHAKLAAK